MNEARKPEYQEKTPGDELLWKQFHKPIQANTEYFPIPYAKGCYAQSLEFSFSSIMCRVILNYSLHKNMHT